MIVEDLYPNWWWQYERMKRWYNRFKEINDGRVAENPNFFYYHDEVYAFFQNCYHLKDWIINDERLSISKQIVDDFINQHRCLQICADVCNGSKHFNINNARSQGSVKMGPASTTIIGQGKDRINIIKYYIETDQECFNAFKLATECIKKWDDFISKNISES